MRWLISSVVCGLLLTACGPNLDNRTVYQKEKRYPHSSDLRTPVALFVRERNGEPNITASAFLIDKNKGLFASAKHFVGLSSDGECKIFFAGKVYEGFVVALPAITDVVVIKIIGDFDSGNFPEPYGFASGIKVGGKVLARGIHAHSNELQAGKIVLPIGREYYGMVWRKDEFVYDNLPGRVTDVHFNIGKVGGGEEAELIQVLELGHTYIRLKMDDDHQQRFAGLSGGPAVNENNELVGINGAESMEELLIDETGLRFKYNNLHLVPIAELVKLRPVLDGFR